MMNIGMNPTVSDGNQRHMEVHLFDFNQDVYGELVKIEFLTKVRDYNLPSVNNFNSMEV